MKNLKRGEILVSVLLGAAASGAVLNYSARSETLAFVKEWVTHPTEVGACTPCSQYVADQMTRFLDTQTSKPLRILEVGAGTGIFTRAIANHLVNRPYVLDVIEINEAFCKSLKKDFKTYSNVTIHQEDITQWKPTQQYDIIISALPFNIFDVEIIQDILASYEQWLVPGGRISYVELAGLPKVGRLFMSEAKKKLFDEKYKVISDFKNEHLDATVTVLRNVPPIYVHHLKF